MPRMLHNFYFSCLSDTVGISATLVRYLKDIVTYASIKLPGILNSNSASISTLSEGTLLLGPRFFSRYTSIIFADFALYLYPV